jgi:hypothetical protein
MPNALRLVDDYIESDSDHPFDGIETILNQKSLAFQRLTDDELFIEYKGRFGLYRVIFVWNQELGAMQFCTQMDMQVTATNTDKALAIVCEINTNLWIGHFDLPHENNIPTYRHTQLLRDDGGSYAINYVTDMIDIAINVCDKHYATFMTLAHEDSAAPDDLFFAMMPAIGRCH